MRVVRMQESEEMAQHIAIEQNKANQSILNDKEALKTYSKKNQGDLLYEWTTDDVIVVMRNSMHNLNKPGVRGNQRFIFTEMQQTDMQQTCTTVFRQNLARPCPQRQVCLYCRC